MEKDQGSEKRPTKVRRALSLLRFRRKNAGKGPDHLQVDNPSEETATRATSDSAINDTQSSSARGRVSFFSRFFDRGQRPPRNPKLDGYVDDKSPDCTPRTPENVSNESAVPENRVQHLIAFFSSIGQSTPFITITTSGRFISFGSTRRPRRQVMPVPDDPQSTKSNRRYSSGDNPHNVQRVSTVPQISADRVLKLSNPDIDTAVCNLDKSAFDDLDLINGVECTGSPTTELQFRAGRAVPRPVTDKPTNLHSLKPSPAVVDTSVGSAGVLRPPVSTPIQAVPEGGLISATVDSSLPSPAVEFTPTSIRRHPRSKRPLSARERIDSPADTSHRISALAKDTVESSVTPQGQLLSPTDTSTECLSRSLDSTSQSLMYSSSELLTEGEVGDGSATDSASEDDKDDQAEASDVVPELKSSQQEVVAPARRYRESVVRRFMNVTKELLTTEKAYQKRLHLLDKVFYEKLRKEAAEINNDKVFPCADVIDEMFPDVAAIHLLSQELTRQLDVRMDNGNSPNQHIGDIMLHIAPLLKMYTRYITSFDRANSQLDTWSKKCPKFKDLVEDIQKDPLCENLSLKHHMLEPVQRIPRYRLLLNEYLKKLPLDSLDRPSSEAALEIISKIADTANMHMKNMDGIKKILELQEMLGDSMKEPLVSAGRTLTKEGKLVKVAARSKLQQTRYFILFNDMMLHCALLPGAKLRLKQKLNLVGTVIKEPEEPMAEIPFSFILQSHQKVIELAAASAEERDSWTSAIRGNVDVLADKMRTFEQFTHKDMITPDDMLGRVAPKWIKDYEVSMCMVCATEFSILHRRHHCRACGRVICFSCLQMLPLAYDNNRSNKVCVECCRKLCKMAALPRNTKVVKRRLQRYSTSRIAIQGFLGLRTTKRSWNQLYCILGKDFSFTAFAAKEDVKGVLSFALPGYEVEDLDPGFGGMKFPFKVYHLRVPDETYVFHAQTEGVKKSWIQKLQAASLAEDLDD